MHPVYLSRVELDPRNREAARMLDNSHFMHGFVNAAVAIDREGAPRWLYHVEQTPKRATLLMQAPVHPTWPDWLTEYVAPLVETKDITPLLAGLPNGRELRFSLAAAPRKRDPRSRKEYPLPEDDRLDWLERQLRPGAALIVARVERAVDIVARTFQGKTQAVNRQVTYTGALKITSPSIFQTLLTSGIGPGKAYGHGMLRLAAQG
jgi:CRISPR system Cascade subunit CasE